MHFTGDIPAHQDSALPCSFGREEVEFQGVELRGACEPLHQRRSPRHLCSACADQLVSAVPVADLVVLDPSVVSFKCSVQNIFYGILFEHAFRRQGQILWPVCRQA